MEAIVPTILKLNDVLHATGDWRLKAPTVVAIGMQSSGKTSVLESLVQRDFLPRGTGLVTRCPLELQLINVPRGTAGGAAEGPEEWAEFGHIEGRRRFTDFAEVRREIVRQTERLAGSNKGIVPTPIGLAIYSPRVPDLHVVDLPGLVKTPAGDQPADIERQVRDMWMSYIGRPDAIILAVVPATQDIFADEALQTALLVDREGDRTVGVLSKVDLMDPGTDCTDIVAGRAIFLKRGFVPVVARSQRDIAEGLPVAAALQRERLFFAQHARYARIAPRCGMGYLSRVLSHLMMAAIRAWLPRVRGEVSLLLQYAEQELTELGSPLDGLVGGPTAGPGGAPAPGAAGQAVLRLLTRFASNFGDMLDGRAHADAAGGDAMLTRVLFGGARIQEHVRSRFAQAVDGWLRAFVSSAHTTLPSAEILMALRNSAGLRPALFIPEAAFVALARRFIVTLKEQGRRFAQYVYDELRRVADQCTPPELARFGELRSRAVEVVHELLRGNYGPTLKAVDAIIDYELSHVNTLHPDFVGAEGARAAVREGRDAALFYGPEAPFDPVYHDSEEEEAEAAAEEAAARRAAAVAARAAARGGLGIGSGSDGEGGSGGEDADAEGEGEGEPQESGTDGEGAAEGGALRPRRRGRGAGAGIGVVGESGLADPTLPSRSGAGGAGAVGPAGPVASDVAWAVGQLGAVLPDGRERERERERDRDTRPGDAARRRLHQEGGEAQWGGSGGSSAGASRGSRHSGREGGGSSRGSRASRRSVGGASEGDAVSSSRSGPSRDFLPGSPGAVGLEAVGRRRSRGGYADDRDEPASSGRGAAAAGRHRGHGYDRHHGGRDGHGYDYDSDSAAAGAAAAAHRRSRSRSHSRDGGRRSDGEGDVDLPFDGRRHSRGHGHGHDGRRHRDSGRDAGGSGSGSESDDLMQRKKAALAAQARHGHGHRHGGHGHGAGYAEADGGDGDGAGADEVNSSVGSSVSQQYARAQGRRRSRSRGEGGRAGRAGSSSSTAAGGSASGAAVINDDVRDVSERFQRHIVADIAGHGPGDPIPLGAVRLGGPHSPYIARPAMPGGVGMGAVGGAGGGMGGAGMGVAAPFASPGAAGGRFGSGSPGGGGGGGGGVALGLAGPAAAGAAGSPIGVGPAMAIGGGAVAAGPSALQPHARAGPYASPGFNSIVFGPDGRGIGMGVEGIGMGADGLPFAAGRRGNGWAPHEISQLPSRPLPAVILPGDLRATPKEKGQVRMIRFMLHSLLAIVAKTFTDMVPKVVMASLVLKSRDDIASSLVQALYSDISNPDLLLKESDDVAARRRTLTDHAAVLRRALAVLSEIRDTAAAAERPEDLPGPTITAPASLAAVPAPAAAGAGAGAGFGSPSSFASGHHYAAGAAASAAARPAATTAAAGPSGFRDFTPWRLGMDGSSAAAAGAGTGAGAGAGGFGYEPPAPLPAPVFDSASASVAGSAATAPARPTVAANPSASAASNPGLVYSASGQAFMPTPQGLMPVAFTPQGPMVTMPMGAMGMGMGMGGMGMGMPMGVGMGPMGPMGMMPAGSSAAAAPAPAAASDAGSGAVAGGSVTASLPSPTHSVGGASADGSASATGAAGPVSSPMMMQMPVQMWQPQPQMGMGVMGWQMPTGMGMPMGMGMGGYGPMMMMPQQGQGMMMQAAPTAAASGGAGSPHSIASAGMPVPFVGGAAAVPQTAASVGGTAAAAAAPGASRGSHARPATPSSSGIPSTVLPGGTGTGAGAVSSTAAPALAQ